MVPAGGVHLRAFEVVQAFDFRPSPVVQNTRRIDENVASVHEFSTSLQVLNFHSVSAVLLNPIGSNYLVLGLDVLVQPVLIGKTLEILIDFTTAGVDS